MTRAELAGKIQTVLGLIEPDALGRTLMSRQPFGNLEMELKTRRGTRWISLSGDPIVDVSGEPFVDLAHEAKMAFARD